MKASRPSIPIAFARIACCYPHSIRASVGEVARAGEWWEYKLAPLFALFYATAFVAGVPVASLWQTALVLICAIAPGATWVSIINDLTDRADDHAAGKRNRMAGRSRFAAAAMIVATVIPGLVFSWLWRKDTLLLTAYLGAWLAYALYSLPPFRFKTRGLAGVLCDAAGAHLFPTLVAVLIVLRDTHHGYDAVWLIATALWSFSYGVRGIVWHQLSDRENDDRVKVRTFAQRHPIATSAHLGAWVAFPLEVIALGVLLFRMRSPWPLLSLALYAFFSWRRMRAWNNQPVIVSPRPRFFLVLHEYYDVYLPLAMLFASALRAPADWLVVPVHLALFPRRAMRAGHDALLLAAALVRSRVLSPAGNRAGTVQKAD